MFFLGKLREESKCKCGREYLFGKGSELDFIKV